MNASQEHDDIPLVRSMSPRAWAQRKAMLPEQRKPRVGVATASDTIHATPDFESLNTESDRELIVVNVLTIVISGVEFFEHVPGIWS